MAAFYTTDPYGLWGDVDPGTGERLLRVRAAEVAYPEEWSFQIGDIVHNFRVVLDYVAFAHACRRDSGITNDAKRIRNVQFPVCGKSGDWESWLPRLGWASDEMRGFLEKVQPYRRTDLANLHPLLVLDRLDKPHKHQTLIQSAPIVSRVDFNLVNDPGGSTDIVGMGVEGPFQDGAVVARVRFNSGKPDARARSPAKIEFRVSFEVAFGGAVPYVGFPVLPLLRDVSGFLRDIILRVEPLI